MTKINDLVIQLRAQSVKVKSIDTELAPLFTEAADAIEHLQRLNEDRLSELEQSRLQRDIDLLQIGTLSARIDRARHALTQSLRTAWQSQAQWEADEVAAVLATVQDGLTEGKRQ